MAQAKFFNRGTLRGTVAKNEIVDYDKKSGAGKGKLLSMEVNTGGTNKPKVTFFATKSNPDKLTEINETWKTNSKVEVSGSITEREKEGSNGRKFIERGINGFTVKAKREDAKDGAFFILQGIVTKLVETEDGANVTVRYEEKFTPTTGELKDIEQTKEEFFTLTADSAAMEVISDVDLSVGCNAKFKGQIFNALDLDDYGDVIGNVQMYLIEKIEDVLQKDEIDEQEKLDFI
ncbi:hypothetical protein [Paenibacillus chitinolyticus]|uniref:hypothetical protein n=1 Tax=Paenibacillus chitinolyticus TaxID=79263 RepID=UPI003D02625B